MSSPWLTSDQSHSVNHYNPKSPRPPRRRLHHPRLPEFHIRRLLTIPATYPRPRLVQHLLLGRSRGPLERHPPDHGIPQLETGGEAVSLATGGNDLGHVLDRDPGFR